MRWPFETADSWLAARGSCKAACSIKQKQSKGAAPPRFRCHGALTGSVAGRAATAATALETARKLLRALATAVGDTQYARLTAGVPQEAMVTLQRCMEAERQRQ